MRKIASFFLLYAVVIFASSAALADGDKAKDFVQGIGDKVIAVVADAKLNDASKEQKLTELFVETVDVDWIGKFVAGRYWREASKEQQQKYMEVYKKFLTDSYVSKFRKYTDQKLAINKSTPEEEGHFLVETSIVDQDGKAYNIDYKLKTLENGKLCIYDIIAEGVSMIATQRSDFSSILSRDGMDGLIAKLAEKKPAA